MIVHFSSTGRPRTDRQTCITLGVSESTLHTIDEIARVTGTSRTDVIEGFVKSYPQHTDLIQCAALAAANENKKYPAVLGGRLADEPELTPEAARENLSPLVKRAFAEGVLVAPAAPVAEGSEEARDEGPNPWTELRAQLIAVIGYDNYETWLDSVRLVSEGEDVVLSCHDAFFQEHLTAHYRDLISDLLQRPVSFVMVEPSTPRTATTATSDPLLSLLSGVTNLDELEAFEMEAAAKIYSTRLDEAAERCTRYQGDTFSGRRKVGFNDARMAEEVAMLKAKRLAEERRREEFSKQRRAIFSVAAMMANLRAGKGAQYHERDWREAAGTAARRVGSSTRMSQSAFETEGGATREDRAQLERALRRKTRDAD